MAKKLGFLYGIMAYAVFFVAFLYAIGFVGNIFVPKSVDVGPEAPWGPALLVNVLLLTLFAIQHSGMARAGFKKWWTRFVPVPLERSTYVLISSLALILLYWGWRPMTTLVWSVESATGSTLLWILFGFGWLLVLLSTFMINHFDLFGLRQVMFLLQGKQYEPAAFQTSWLYRFVRHPIMLGFIIAFWATPSMTLGHLVFSIATTGYILVGIHLEERDMVNRFGSQFLRYRDQVSMLVPTGKIDESPAPDPNAAKHKA